MDRNIRKNEKQINKKQTPEYTIPTETHAHHSSICSSRERDWIENAPAPSRFRERAGASKDITEQITSYFLYFSIIQGGIL
jgi:hypothetical protein